MRDRWWNTGFLVAILAAGGFLPQVVGVADKTPPAPNAVRAKAAAKQPAPPGPKGIANGEVGGETPLTLWTSYGASYFSGEPDRGSVEVVIALVPDPVASRMAAMFDAVVEGLQRAAEDHGFTYDRYFLPWDREESKPKRAGEPGLILFRRLDLPDETKKSAEVQATLALFLVGETPSSGIDVAAFQKAVDLGGSWSKAAAEGQLRIAGPSFSGSIPSLSMALRQTKWKGKAIRVISGSATNASNQARMASTPKVSYSATVHDDDLAMQRFIDWVDGPRIAILSESGTAYGAGVRSGSGATLSLPFPMEIGRLRNAYQSDPAMRAAVTGEKVAAPPSGLGLKLTDANRVTDRIPAYSPDVTAVGQELTLKNIADSVRRNGIGLVGIVATDILDGLFVTDLVRRYCPNVRPFLLDSDALFQHNSSGMSFYGTLLVTTYPMYGTNQAWLDDAIHNVTHFPNRNAEGAYNATRLLLGGTDGRSLDYANPFDERATEPPLWLTVVGHGGVWPISLLTGAPAEGHHRLTPGRSVPLKQRPLPPASLIWYVLLVGTWLPLVVPVRLGTDLTRRAIDLPISDGWFYEFATNLSCLTAALPLAVLQVFYVGNPTGQQWFDRILAMLGVLVCLVFLGRAVFALRGSDFNSRRSLLLLTTAVILTFFFGMYLVSALTVLGYQLHDAEYPTVFFRVLRSLSPANGVAPVVPVTALALGFFAWSRMQLRKMQLRHLCDPGWVPVGKQEPRLAGLDDAVAELRASAEAFLPAAPWKTLIGLGTIVVVGQFALANSFRSLEGRAWELFVFYGGSLMVALLLLDTVRVLALWFRLETCLFHLEAHPVTQVLDQLTTQTATLRPQDGFVMRETRWLYRNLSATLERLLRMEPNLLSPVREVAIGAIDRIQQVFHCHAVRTRPCLAEVATLHAQMNQLTPLLLPDWDAPRITPQQQLIREYRALRIAAMVHYAYRQIWNRIGFLSLGFLLFLLAMVTYPFQPHRTLSVLLAVLLLSLGGVVLFLFVRFDRNAVLSRMNGSEPGKVGGNFLQWALTYGALPLATFLLSQFPEFSRPLFSILDPALRAMK